MSSKVIYAWSLVLTLSSAFAVLASSLMANENTIPGLEENKCGNTVFLDQCLKKLPSLLKSTGKTALPLTENEINLLCRAYKAGIECMDTWSTECLAADLRIVAEQQSAGARQMMAFLCHDESFRKEYLNHTICFKAVSIDWDRCFAIFNAAIKETTQMDIALQQQKLEMCCSRQSFQTCIMKAGRSKCDRDAAIMLRRMSETLSADSVYAAKCKTMDITKCAGHRHIFLESVFNRHEITYINVVVMLLIGIWLKLQIFQLCS